MAILCGTGDGLTQTGTFLNPASDWTFAGWLYTGTLPQAGEYTTLLFVGDPSYATPWIWVGISYDGGPSVLLVEADPGSGEVDTVASDPLVADTWYYVAVRYDASGPTIDLLVNAISTGTPASLDLSAMAPPTTLDVGTDTTGDSIGSLALADLGIWQVALTTTEIAVQMIRAAAQVTTGLLLFTPLVTASDLADTSGNARNWTAIGTLATAGSTPPICTATSGPGVIAASLFNTALSLRSASSGSIIGTRFLPVDLDNTGITTGETDIIPSTGRFAQTILNLAIYERDGTLVATPSLGNTVGPGGVRVANGHFYAIQVTFGGMPTAYTSKLYAYDADGVEIDHWTLAAPATASPAGSLSVLSFAVSPNESTCYYSGSYGATPTDPVYLQSFDLNTSMANPDLDTRTSGADFTSLSISSLLCLPSGNVVAAWDYIANDPTIHTEIRLAQYESDGTPVNEVVLTEPDQQYVTRLATSLTPTTTYWTTWGGTTTLKRLSEINHQAGVVVSTVNTPRTVDGVGGTYTPFFVTRTPDGPDSGLPYTPSSTPAPSPGTTRAIRWERVFPLPFDMNLQVFLSRLEIFLQQGVGLSSGQGSDPVLFLSISKDGGQTFGNEIQMSVGKQGQYAFRTYANRLGRGRNLVAKIAGSDPVFIGLVAAFVDADEGTS